MEKLSDLINIQKGVTAFVGGGGKTSTIYQLAKELSAKGERVIVTTTTKMYVPKDTEVQTLLITPTLDQIKDALKQFRCIGIGGGILDDKIMGVTEDSIDEMKSLVEYVLVEADGAKHLPIKVPNINEPVIPKRADQVVAVVGMSALGQKIETCCFRKERVTELLGVDEVHRLEPQDLVKIITSCDGLRKGVGNRRFAILLNQMDTLKDEGLAKCMHSQIIKHKIDQVVLASLHEKRWWHGNRQEMEWRK